MDPISLIISAMYAFVIIWEKVFPAKTLPTIPWWKTRALSVFVVYFFLASYLPLIIEPFLAAYQLFDLSIIGVVSGALIAVILYEKGVNFWHGAMHSNVVLRRVFH